MPNSGFVAHTEYYIHPTVQLPTATIRAFGLKQATLLRAQSSIINSNKILLLKPQLVFVTYRTIHHFR